MSYKIYTDGSCSNNGKKNSHGGWAFVVMNNDDEILYEESGYNLNTTNNQMELFAIIKAIEYCEKQLNNICDIKIISDSAYFINCYEQNWYLNWLKNGWLTSGKKKVANKDLWERIIPFFSDARFNFEKVKGHDISKGNNRADILAVNAHRGF